jgi:hypothetical protein
MYRVVITSFMVMSDVNLKNSQIYLKWVVMRVYFGFPQNQGQRGAETNGLGRTWSGKSIMNLTNWRSWSMGLCDGSSTGPDGIHCQILKE